MPWEAEPQARPFEAFFANTLGGRPPFSSWCHTVVDSSAAAAAAVAAANLDAAKRDVARAANDSHGVCYCEARFSTVDSSAANLDALRRDLDAAFAVLLSTKSPSTPSAAVSAFETTCFNHLRELHRTGASTHSNGGSSAAAAAVIAAAAANLDSDEHHATNRVAQHPQPQ